LAQADEELAALEAAHSSRRKYPALRSIGGWIIFWSWVNWLVGAATLLGGVGAALYYRKDFPLPSGVGALSALWVFLAQAALALILRAIGELIYLAIDVEKNTRDAAAKSITP
jgi:hypothetical protein